MNAVKIMIQDFYKSLIKNVAKECADVPKDELKKAKTIVFKDVDMRHFAAETDRIIKNKNDGMPVEIMTPMPVYKKVCNNIGAILAEKQILISDNMIKALDYYTLAVSTDMSYENITDLLKDQCKTLSAVIDNNTFCDYLFDIMRPALKIQLESAYRNSEKSLRQSLLLGNIDEQLDNFAELANQLLIERNK